MPLRLKPGGGASFRSRIVQRAGVESNPSQTPLHGEVLVHAHGAAGLQLPSLCRTQLGARILVGDKPPATLGISRRGHGTSAVSSCMPIPGAPRFRSDASQLAFAWRRMPSHWQAGPRHIVVTGLCSKRRKLFSSTPGDTKHVKYLRRLDFKM